MLFLTTLFFQLIPVSAARINHSVFPLLKTLYFFTLMKYAVSKLN